MSTVYLCIDQGHLGCLQVFAVTCKAGINMHMSVFPGNMFSLPLDKYQRVQLLDRMVKVCLVLWETARLSSRVAILSVSSEGDNLCCFSPSPAFGGVWQF